MNTYFPPGFQLLAVVLLATLLNACSQAPTSSKLPEHTDQGALTAPQQQRYEQALRAGQNGDYAKASDHLERLVQQRPGRAELWLQLATAYYHREHWPQAQKALENTLTLAPTLAAAHNLAGTLALEREDIEAAKQHFLEALQHDDSHADAHYNLALVYDTYYQELRPAITHYELYLELTEGDDERTTQWVQQLQHALERQGG